MKKFICGFLVGAIVFSLVGVYAATTYVANPLSYKVLVNGEEFTSDPPPVEIEGRTYLPLRAMGDALGVPVNWNEELRQAEIGDSTYYKKNSEVYYKESGGVVDIGAKYGLKVVKTDKLEDSGDELITYYYDITDTGNFDGDWFDDLLEYIDINGYEISQGENKTEFPTMEKWYYAEHSSDKLPPFAIGLIEDYETFEVYVAISFLRESN